MTITEQRTGDPLSPDKQLSLRIQELWRDDALKVWDLTKDHSLVIIGAPGGSGKSENMSPMLVKVAQENNWHPWKENGQRWPPMIDDIVPSIDRKIRKHLDPTDASIAIIDEPLILGASTPEEYGEQISRVLRKVRTQFSRTIALLRTQTPEEEGILTALFNAEQKLNGTPIVYRMTPKVMPLATAQDMFIYFYPSTPSEVRDFILEHFPLYPTLINKFRSAKNIAGLKTIWRNMQSIPTHGWGITQEEAEAIDNELKK